VTGLREQLEQQRQAVTSYRQEIQQIELAIEVGRLQVGVGDVRYQRDETLRQEYAALVARERQLSGGRASDLDPLFARAQEIESTLDQRDARIDQVVEQRVQEIRRVLDEETANVAGYQQAIASLETETEEVVGAVTHATFTDVRHRFYDLVLRADVGRIDVSWARREEHRMRVDMLTRERSRDIRALDDEFRDIMDEVPESPTEEGTQ
jgi:chromosome segregation ATPase